MSDVTKPTNALRSQILSNPQLVLEDSEVMEALLQAGGGAARGRNVVDLRAKLVDRLEGRLGELEETHKTVIAAAYENLAGTNQIHRAVLSLLDGSEFHDFLAALGQEVPTILSVDALRVGLETSGRTPGTSLGPHGPLEDLLIALPRGGIAAYLGETRDRPGRRVTLRRSGPETEALFGPGAALVRSEAVLKLDLGEGRRPAVAMLGSEDPQRFNSDQGTDLLGFFAGVLERILRRWLG